MVRNLYAIAVYAAVKSHGIMAVRYDTIRYDTVYLTCSKKSTTLMAESFPSVQRKLQNRHPAETNRIG